MPNTLLIGHAEYNALIRHLLGEETERNDEEQVAFSFADVAETGSGVLFQSDSFHFVPRQDFDFQSSFHVSLTDEALARVIKRAWDCNKAIVEFHSHTDPHFPPAFSASDLEGFDVMVPHVRWRLRAKPYLAVVISPVGYDALVWRGDMKQPEGLDGILIDDRLERPTGKTLKMIGARIANW